MSYNQQTEFNIIHVFALEYYKNSFPVLHEVLLKMETFLKERTNGMDKNMLDKIMSGARDVDNDTLDVLAHSHNVCIEVNEHPDPNVQQFYNTTSKTVVILNLGSNETNTTVVSNKRKRTEDLTPTKAKVSKKFNQGRIKHLFIDNVESSYHKARKETDSLVFTNLKIHLHHATIIRAFQKAQTLNNVDKFEFYRKLKNIYMKEYINCWNVCVYEISKISNNSEKVQEHVNNHSVAVESILYTYLNDSLKEYFENAWDRKKGMTEHFSTKLEKISMDQVKKKLKTLLTTYIEGFLDILSEK
jgi:hypothetical protein